MQEDRARSFVGAGGVAGSRPTSARHRVGSHARSAASRPPRDANADDEHRRVARPRAGDRRQLGQLHRDAGLERIGRAERAADHRRAGAHRDHGDGVDAEAAAEQQQHRHERDDLLLHVLERAHRREEERDDRNREETAAAEARRRAPPTSARERAEPIDHHPRAAHEQDDGDDVGRFDESARQRDHGRERTDRRGSTG